MIEWLDLERRLSVEILRLRGCVLEKTHRKDRAVFKQVCSRLQTESFVLELVSVVEEGSEIEVRFGVDSICMGDIIMMVVLEILGLFNDF